MNAADTLSPRIVHYAAASSYRCAARRWDVSAPRGRVVLLHGIISHGGWYLKSCRALAAAGFETHFLERRGSGLNVVARGDVDCYQTWIEDVHLYLKSLGADLPRLLLGVSWGGKLALAVAKRAPHEVSGVGMLCPGLYAPRGPNAVQRKLLAVATAVGLGARQVTIPLQDPALFTDNPRWQDYIRSDPLVLRKISLRFAHHDVQLDRYLDDAAATVQTPALLMLAGRDHISDNERLRQFFATLQSPNKTLIEYPDAAHTLEFELGAGAYLTDLTGWLLGKNGTPSAVSGQSSPSPPAPIGGG